MPYPNPAVMPVISRNVPAFSNDDYSGAFPASHANNAVYGDYWRCQTAPTGNTDSGTLTQNVWLAYDLSGVSSSHRGACVLVWHNDPSTGAYNATLISNNHYNLPTNYTIEANAGAGGGAAPSSGWIVLATITSNVYHSRQHAINLTGYNWVRLNITTITGSAFNNNAACNMDIHDASAGNQDNWIFYGDSITQRGLDMSDTTLAAQISASKPLYYPLMEDGGMAGWTAVEGAANVATFLSVFTGKYVTLNFGANDASQGGSYISSYQTNMTTMINAVLSANKIPIVPKITWGTAGSMTTNLPTLNGIINTLYGTFPTVLPGPDLYTYYQANQSLISGDGLHPTDPAGYGAYRTQWLNWAIANLYTPLSSGETSFFDLLHFGRSY